MVESYHHETVAQLSFRQAPGKFDCYTTMTIAFMVLAILCLSFVIELPEFTKTFPRHDGGVRNKPGRFCKLIFVLQFFFSRLAKFEMTVESANEG